MATVVAVTVPAAANPRTVLVASAVAVGVIALLASLTLSIADANKEKAE